MVFFSWRFDSAEKNEYWILGHVNGSEFYPTKDDCLREQGKKDPRFVIRECYQVVSSPPPDLPPEFKNR